MKILHFVPPHILELTPYSSARSLYRDGLLLDANENAHALFGRLNRYPDGSNTALRTAITRVQGIAPEECAVGNGSDELIDLLFRVFCVPGDNVVVPVPTYGAYARTAAIQDVTVRAIPTVDWQPDVAAINRAIDDRSKIIWLCSPNNPTGNRVDDAIVLALLKSDRLVVVDEAYADFSNAASWVGRIRDFENLVVVRTLSKAYALAGARVGYACARAEIIDLLQKIQLPYNLNTLTTQAALRSLDRRDVVAETAARIIAERERVADALANLPDVEHVFPSETNFILFRIRDADRVFTRLVDSGIIVRSRTREPMLENCLRVTIGTPQQNDAFLYALHEILGRPNPRTRSSALKRSTTETDIEIRVNLNGTGTYAIHTGVRFLDHMLEQLAKHSGIDIELMADGDVDVDEHHTIEDTAIALGRAIRLSLGDKRGMGRYGFVLPMDESLSYCAIDFSGRPVCVFDGQFFRESVGGFPTEMAAHWFKSFSDHAGLALHVQVKGENDHHKIESAFKALGQCLRQALRQQGDVLPTTKGIL